MELTSKERSDDVTDSGNENIRNRHIERQKKRIRQMKRRRITTISVLSLVVLIVVIFFTPIFKIRKIEVNGNQKITTEEIVEKLEGSVGKNIFRYRVGNSLKNIKSMPYIDSVEIAKSAFSSKLTVNITECIPAGFFEVGEKNVVIDNKLKVLEVAEDIEYEIPVIEDVTVVQVELGNGITLENEEIFNVVKKCLTAISDEGILDGVKYISFENSDNITFNYQDRLDVVCGNTDNFKKKIKLFNQALNTQKLSDKSRGTIDLSVSGQAVYTP